MSKLIQEIDTTIIRAFRGRGYKATPQRIAISRFALCDHKHPTVHEVYCEVRKTYPTVSLATVYKTIQILKEIGLVHELNLQQDQTRLDSNLKPHLNLVCLRCGNIKDLEDPMIEAIISRLSAAEQFAPTEQRFDVYGICANCRRSVDFKASDAAKS